MNKCIMNTCRWNVQLITEVSTISRESSSGLNTKTLVIFFNPIVNEWQVLEHCRKKICSENHAEIPLNQSEECFKNHLFSTIKATKPVWQNISFSLQDKWEHLLVLENKLCDICWTCKEVDNTHMPLEIKFFFIYFDWSFSARKVLLILNTKPCSLYLLIV